MTASSARRTSSGRLNVDPGGGAAATAAFRDREPHQVHGEAVQIRRAVASGDRANKLSAMTSAVEEQLRTRPRQGTARPAALARRTRS